jgi:hypothetical protein
MRRGSPTGKRRNGLAAFRAVEAEVVAALGAGRTVRAIYEEKQARLAMSYAQFARYAQPLRKAIKSQTAALRVATAVPPLRQALEHREAASARTRPPKGRPEDAVPTLDMDGFATRVLKNEDLF